MFVEERSLAALMEDLISTEALSLILHLKISLTCSLEAASLHVSHFFKDHVKSADVVYLFFLHADEFFCTAFTL